MKKFTFFTILIVAVTNGYCTNADSASFYVKQALEQNQNNKAWEADKSFQKAIAFDPTDLQIRIEYGNYLTEKRKYFLAVAQYIKVLESNINHPVALQKMTELNFQLHRWNDVVLYGSKLDLGSTSKDLKFMLGRSFYELENYGQAQKYLYAAMAENPKNIEAVTLLGKVLIEMSNYKQAINVYNQTLELDPNNNQLIYELGLLYYSMNDEKSAIKYFEQAAEKGLKKDLDFLENLGMAYLGQDIKKGVKILEQVLDKKPGNSEILFQIGQAYYKAEKFQEAATTYFQIYSADPSNIRALYMTGVAFQKKGDKQKGIALCEEAIAKDPSLAMLKSQKFSF